MKKSVAIATSKIIKKTSRLAGYNGSHLPGKIARKIDKNILRKIRNNVDTLIFVSGTNGKTTTAQMVAHILKEKAIIHNKEGSNLIEGITSSFIDSQNVFGNKKVDFGIIEVDEGSISNILKEITPDHFLFTNIYEDQIERHGTVSDLSKRLKWELESKDINYVLNANDPYISNIGIEAESVTYYGIDTNNLNEFTHLGRVFSEHKKLVVKDVFCPNCGNKLCYKEILENKLGLLKEFDCKEQCGLKTNKPKYKLNNILYKNDKVDVNGNYVYVKRAGEKCYGENDIVPYINNKRFITNLTGNYNSLNVLAAYSLCKELGLTDDTIKRGLSSFFVGSGRMENFEVKDSQVLLNLAKNAAGVNVTLEWVAEHIIKYENVTLVFAFNNNEVDGVTHGWLNEINLNLIEKGISDNVIKQILCTGQLRLNTKGVLERKGFKADVITKPEETIRIALRNKAENPRNSQANLNNRGSKINNKKNQVVVISNYTMLPIIKKSLTNIMSESQPPH